MHTRICCCSFGNEIDKEDAVQNQNVKKPEGDSVIIKEPKSMPDERITEISIDGSSVQAMKVAEGVTTQNGGGPSTTNVQQSTRAVPSSSENENETSTTNVQQSTKPATRSSLQKNNNESSIDASTTNIQQSTTPVIELTPPLPSDSSSFNFNSDIDDEPVMFTQNGPCCFRGVYKGRQFTIKDEQMQATNGAYTPLDEEFILQNYSQLENGSRFPANPAISVNHITRNGEKSTMTFERLNSELFSCSHNDRNFLIFGGKVLTADGSLDGLDVRLILTNYSRALTGMEQLEMQPNLMETDVDFLRMNAPMTSHDILRSGQDTLTRMRSLTHPKRPSILEERLIAHPRQSSIVKEEISEKSNKSRWFDQIDGGNSSNIPEPVLPKIAFTPTAIIYDDPKTYEKLDKYEQPIPKPLDDYIISMDGSLETTSNRYYFHPAKPKRVTRKQRTPQELLQITSLERYSLFQSECLKVHNKLRKMHGVAPLIHSDFLCLVATEWAEYLALKDAFYHRPNNKYGENLYYGEKMDVCARQAVLAWYDEIDLYDYNNPGFDLKTGHFTQLVWKDTKEMGTGVAQIGNKLWVCCNYSPPGNVSGKFNDEFVPRPLVDRLKKT